MLPDMSTLSLADTKPIPHLTKLRIATVGGVDPSIGEDAITSCPIMEVLKPYATEMVAMETDGQFIEFKDAAKAAALIQSRIEESSSLDKWWDIKREYMGGGLRLIFNTHKKLWFLIPKAVEKTEAKGAFKRGRKAVLLYLRDGQWRSEVVWYLRPISKELCDKFLKSREIEDRIKSLFKDDKTNPFVQLIADFDVHKRKEDDKWVERRAFYKYVPNELLNEMEKDKLSDQKKVEIAYKLIDLVWKMHSKNVVCRDLKPDNILLDGTNPKLCDMDFVLDEKMVEDLAEGDIAGTAYYIAPEFAKALRESGSKLPKGLKALKANDIFALGCTLNHLCADGVDVPWFREREDHIILGYQKARDHFTKKVYPLKNIFLSKRTKIDAKKRLHELSRWMLNGSPKNRPTAQQALDVVKRI